MCLYRYFIYVLLGATFIFAPARAQEVVPTADAATPAQAAPKSPEEELAPQPELGPRLLTDMSAEAQRIQRARLMSSTTRPMAPVPSETKKRLYDQMTQVTGMSMKEMFNFMTAKKKVKEGISFDDVIESMDIKANEVNFKKVGHNLFWKDVGATSGVPTLRVEILHYCDAVVGRKMLDFAPEFASFIPCRIVVMEDADGSIWLMTLDWDVSWLAQAWNPDSKLGDELKADALRIRDAITAIMDSGASGEW